MSKCALHNADTQYAERFSVFSLHALAGTTTTVKLRIYTLNVSDCKNRNFLIDYPAHKQNRVM